MKAKSIFQCAALLTGLLFLNVPLFAAVESSIVGYATVDVDSLGYAIHSLPFIPLGATVKGYPIKDIAGNLSQSNRLTMADSILVMDSSTKKYTTYRYKAAGWVKDGETEVTQDIIKPGDSVFINKAKDAGSFTVMGEVLTDPTWTCNLTVGLNLVANPYPTAIRITDLRGELSQSNRLTMADAIMLLDPVSKAYTTYVFKTSTGWTKQGETTTTTDEIPAYQGFFYQKAQEDGSLTFTNPLAN
ncbi:MAG: hypothetical protein MSB12_00005 [Lentisphaeraceae bacterium]|nr:hypothetical protein [Lentisphaeraceae bacterium]